MKKLLKALVGILVGATALAFASCDKGRDVVQHTHAFENETITKKATCLEKGEKTFLCSCGETKIIYTAELGHSLKRYEAKSPTCSEIGWENYEDCERDGCDYTTYKEIAINSNGHTFKDGVCSRCEEKYFSTEFEYALIGNTYYEITGIGQCKDKEIYIPETYNGLPVKSIGMWAFSSCDLTNVIIPNSITSIGQGAFKDCASLTSIKISESVTSVGIGAFYNTGYYNDKNNWVNDVLYIDKCLLSMSPTTNETYIIKEGTICIADYAFSYYKPAGDGWVWESIEQNYSLTNVVIPNGVLTIGAGAFTNCSYLTNVIIPDSVMNIGRSAFFGLDGLTSIIIPDSVTSIGSGAFASCTSLVSITVNTNNANYKDINGNLYSKDGNMLIQYAIGKTETDFTIPDHVTSIENSAFRASESLTSIIIPDSVESIKANAFYGCGNLTTITIGKGVIIINQQAFSYCRNLISATFKNPNGWNLIRGVSLSSTDLSDTATAAEYLRSTYCSKNWTRE